MKAVEDQTTADSGSNDPGECPPKAKKALRISMVGVKGLPHPGGIEIAVQEVGRRLVQRGHQVNVYVRPHYTPKSSREFLGMRLVNLPSIPTKHLDAFTHAFVATLHAMWEGVDVLQLESIGFSPFAVPLRLRRIKTVVRSHGLDWQRKKWGVFAKSYLRAADCGAIYLPDATTVVSRKLQQYYENHFGRPVIYIPNGVNVSPQVAPQKILDLGLQGGDYIFFASRLVPEKGLHYLLQAYKQLRNPSKKLVIAGDANYKSPYANEMKAEANENILFLGFATGQLLQELLSWAYVYVLPSEIEGLSIGLLEAMAYGNCVLVSDIEENLEAVGDSGLSFKSGDVPDLKEKLEQLLASEDLVRQYREKAQGHVHQHYNWDRVTDQYENLYQGLIGK